MIRTTASWASAIGMALLASSTAESAAPQKEQVIDIGSGRRLFLDDRLLDLSRCRDVTRVLNPPRDIRRILTPDRPWESLGFIFYANVLEDSKEIKLYYTSYEWKNRDLLRHSCLATSSDGIHFERARLGKKEFDGVSLDVNFVYPTAIEAGIFLDPHASAEKRYRMVRTGKGGVFTASSADGIHWQKNPTCLLPFIPDSQHTAFWDERLQKYVVYLRAWAPNRSVCRIALDNIDTPWPYDTSIPPFFIWGKDKTPTLSHELPIVLAPDEQDPENLDLYTSVVTPYPFADEAYLAFPAAYLKLKGPEWEHCSLGGSDGLFEVQLAVSPDGITWNRWRQPYVAAGYQENLDLRLVSMGQGMIRRGRWLYQYFVGWPHKHGQMGVWRNNPAEGDAWTQKDKGGIYLAKQRLDGFVSMDSAYTGGVLTTRPLLFTGNRLVLNIDTHGTGRANVALTDVEGVPIPGFTADACEIIQGDDTDHVVRWKGGADLSSLEGRPICVQIEMRNTKVYALQFQQVKSETSSGTGGQAARIPGEIPSLKTVNPTDIQESAYDLVVVGGTPGGIACAVRAAREGLRVLLVNHTLHLGGFMTSGAGGWEAPCDGLRAPLYGEMRTAATEYYRRTYGEGSQQHLASMPSATTCSHLDRAKVEPRVAEMLFNRMVNREENLTVLPGYVVTSAVREGSLLKQVVFKPLHLDGAPEVTVSARVFVDAMYEGDLMAAAGATTQIGREARTQYNEPHAGVIYTMERAKAEGQRGFPLDADKGLLNIRYNSHATAEIVEGPDSGRADSSVMAYNYRLILTRDPDNRTMVSKPANYDAELARQAAGTGLSPNFVPNLPNNKVGWNHRGRLVGPQNAYPGADWPERERIAQRYLDAMLMALWYIQNDPEVDPRKRDAFAGYGLAADEFTDNGHIPYEIYVREARRLVGRAVFTEHDNVVADGIARTPIHADSVAITDWPIDSVACLPRSVGKSHQDGVFFLAEEARPAQVPYRCLLPREIDNLLVPVALSASHVGWGPIRLEPVWMQTGESAGFAAALAVKHNLTPSALDPDTLLRTLVTNGITVTFFNDADPASGDPQTVAAQYFGTKGFFADYNARLNEPLSEVVARLWQNGFEQLKQKQLDPARLAAAVHRAETQPSPPLDKTRGEFLLQLWNSLDRL